MPEIKHWREDPEEELARLIPTNEMTNFWSSNIDIINRMPRHLGVRLLTFTV